MSGMASSNLGWRELPYAALPASINNRTLQFTDLPKAGRRVRLISGLRSATDVVLGSMPGSHARAFLSGVLIGAGLLTLAVGPSPPLVLTAGPDLAR